MHVRLYVCRVAPAVRNIRLARALKKSFPQKKTDPIESTEPVVSLWLVELRVGRSLAQWPAYQVAFNVTPEYVLLSGDPQLRPQAAAFPPAFPYRDSTRTCKHKTAITPPEDHPPASKQANAARLFLANSSGNQTLSYA